MYNSLSKNINNSNLHTDRTVKPLNRAILKSTL